MRASRGCAGGVSDGCDEGPELVPGSAEADVGDGRSDGSTTATPSGAAGRQNSVPPTTASTMTAAVAMAATGGMRAGKRRIVPRCGASCGAEAAIAGPAVASMTRSRSPSGASIASSARSAAASFRRRLTVVRQDSHPSRCSASAASSADDSPKSIAAAASSSARS